MRERVFETIGNERAEILAATIFEIVVEECRDHIVERGIGTHDGSGQTGACGNIGAVTRDEDSVGSDGIELAEAGDCGILEEPLEIGDGAYMLIVSDEIGI